MHNIEPYWKWRDYYTAERDKKSPFFGKQYSEFSYTDKIYNYYIHPQWDDFGSPTLFMKLLFVHYVQKFAIIELFGEWNDCVQNDIMFLKRDIVDVLIANGVNKFIVVGENVLNFHASDTSYYEEWWDDISTSGGWIVGLNFAQHVLNEMYSAGIHQYIFLGDKYHSLPWRNYLPHHLVAHIDNILIKKIE